jgi:iron-sulfur cluster assembly accessory protein
MTDEVTISASAAARIKAIAGEGGLRVAVRGGGCSGFAYDIALVAAPDAGDHVYQRAGARVFVDDVSLAFLKGSEVDWVEELVGAAFKVVNPNARTSCGCGISFSI